MAFQISEGARRKHVAAAARLLDPSTTHIDYVLARGHPRLGTPAIVAVSVFGVAFVVALAMGRIVVPGLALLIVAYYGVFPPRGVVIADQGVAVLHRSIWLLRPAKVIALLTHDQMAQVQAIAKGSKAEMAFGPERLTFTNGEWARFTAAVQKVSGNWTANQHLSAAGPPPSASVPGAPPPGGGPLPPPPGAPTAPAPPVEPPSYTGLPPIPGVDVARAPEPAPPDRFGGAPGGLVPQRPEGGPDEPSGEITSF